ncbi:MAG: glycosyltransferase family 2 protein [Bacteroidota bacterium]
MNMSIDEIKVSIIIPAYNSEQYIAETIKSAMAQTWRNKEIIIVDDGSTDNTLQIAKSFESLGVKIIHQPNKGAAAARNIGLATATGTYIQFLDADDLLSSDKIESQLNCLNGSFTHLAICKSVHFADGEDHLAEQPVNNWFNTDTDNPVDFLTKLYAGNEIMIGYGGMIPMHSWLTPRSLIDNAGPWNEELSVNDDGEFFCRVILASEGIRFDKYGVCYYRKFSKRVSLSAQKNHKAVQSAVTTTDLIYRYLKAASANNIIDKIFARHYWWIGVLAYPQYKDLSARCIKTATALGYTGEKYVGGPIGHTLTNLLGWKAVRYFVYVRSLLKTK